MNKVLITGADSFIGSNIKQYSMFNEIKEVCLLENSISDINFKNYNAIIHLAAIVHQSQTIPESEYFKINRDLCLDVAKEAKKQGVKQFVFFSTVKVYGEYSPEKGTWTETSDCEPNDPYGKSKYEAELGLKQLENENFIVSIIRPPLVYGVGVKANMLNIIRLVQKTPILPFRNINNKRSFVATENLIHLVDLVIDKQASGVFLPLDEKPLSTSELVEMIADCLDKKIFLFSFPKFFISIGKKILPKYFDRLYGSFEMDNELTRKVLAYKPVISTKEALKKMIENLEQ